MSKADQPVAAQSEKKRALLAALLRDAAAGSSSARSVPRRTSGAVVPLTYAQESLWLFDQMMPATPTYNIATRLRLSGPLEVKVLGESINELIRRHEILRTTFEVSAEGPVQRIAPSLVLPLDVDDLQELREPEREERLSALVSAAANEPFDLARGPLLRTSVWRVGPDEHVFLVVMHHIISEASSVAVFLQELSTVYEALLEGRPSPLSPLPFQYGDYAIWQRQQVRDRESLDAHVSFWREQLRGPLPVLELPADRPRPAVRTCSGRWQSTAIPAGVTAGLRQLSQREGATLFMTLLAAFASLLHRYTGQDDIIVGSAAANRDVPGLDRLIGYFINPQPLRVSLTGNPSFRQLLGQVRGVCLDALTHLDVPLEVLIDELRIERPRNSNPLFQTAFVLHHAAPRSSWRTTFAVSGVQQRAAVVRTSTAKLDLTLEIEDTGDRLAVVFEYNSDLFDDETIARMLRHFETLLHGIVSNPDQAVERLPLLTDGERIRMLREWNDTGTPYPRNRPIHQVFEEQVRRSPEAIAAVLADPAHPPKDAPRLTYGELNRRANRAAHRLAKLGVGPESLVGLCMERSLEMLVSILGILKAGGGYVPLDPSYPSDRLAQMIADSRVDVLLAQESLAGILPTFGGARIDVDAACSCFDGEPENDSPPQSAAENIAYVMFTSGSTGVPKGVAVPHRAVVRLVRNTNYAEFGPDEVFLQFAPVSFDASTLELWGALLNGGQVVMFPPSMPTLEELGRVIREYGVTTLWLTSALFNVMVEQRMDDLRGVRQLLSGGDVLSLLPVNRVVQDLECQLINGYGPTENTTFTCCYRVPRKQTVKGSVPIGRPISNSRVYVLDSNMEPVPIGVLGELYIGGDGLARGYINRPDLTGERFVANPLPEEPGTVLYRTGDVVRYRTNGDIEFIGRRDHQIKLRGYRIELGEIESVLSAHPSLADVVVTVRSSTLEGRQLIAYVVPRVGHSFEVSELRSFLRRSVPEYMVPSAFVTMTAFPMTPNGKVDRAALPAPESCLAEDGRAYVPPDDELERLIASVWQELLGVERVGIHDNFFELGGNSLLTTQVMTRLRGVLHAEFPLRDLFEEPTVAELAGRLRSRGIALRTDDTQGVRAKAERQHPLSVAGDDTRFECLIPMQPKGSRRPLFLVAGAHADEDQFLRYLSNIIRHLGTDQPVYGFKARGLDGRSAPHRTVEEMACEYIREMRTFLPEGPYLLSGECVGGLVAYEMAQQLRAGAEQVGLLVLMDTVMPDDEFTEAIERAYGRWKPNRLVTGWKRLSEMSSSDRLSYGLDLGGRALRMFLPLGGESRRLDHVRRVERDYPRILSHYRPRPYAGRLTLIINEEEQARRPAMGWQPFVEDLEVIVVPGDHGTRLTKFPRISAERLRKCLDPFNQDLRQTSDDANGSVAEHDRRLVRAGGAAS